MDSKWQLDGAVLGSNGLPQRVEGLEEALQNAALRLCLIRGSLPYQPWLGSGLRELSPKAENSAQRAWALAGEALIGSPGVEAAQAQYDEETASWLFQVTTPWGTGAVSAPGKEEEDGKL